MNLFLRTIIKILLDYFTVHCQDSKNFVYRLQVTFIDYGNRALVSTSEIRALKYKF